MADALIDAFTGVVCDLDGVVYAGPQPIPHAVDALNRCLLGAREVVYATNNASRAPESVAAHLRELGLDVSGAAVLNSSMAGAHVLARSLERGTRVLAVGGPGVAAALEAAGLTPVPADDERRADVVAVLQGYGAGVTAADLAQVAHAVQNGARWVATNTDRTLPTDRGIAPGNGSLVAAVGYAVDVDPEVVGKPEPVMYELAAEIMGRDARDVLAIGDRLETDIEGAVSAGMPSALVLTGVHGWADAVAAPARRRPTYVVEDLRALFEPYEVGPRAWPPPRTLALAAARGALHEAWSRIDAGSLDADDAAQVFTQSEITP